MPQRRGDRSASVERAFEFLGLVAGHGSEGIALSELARASGLPVSTCHRYVTTLLDLNALRRGRAARLFLGTKLISLAQASLDSDSLRILARPILEELSQYTEETVHLGRHTTEGVVYVDKIESIRMVRMVSRIGTLTPHHCSAMGKAILAALSPDEREGFITRATQVFTSRTLTGDALREELEKVAVSRVSFDEQEFEEGVRCVAAAITNRDGEPFGAISVSGPMERFSRKLCDDLAPTVLAAATRVGREVSWPASYRRTTAGPTKMRRIS